MSRADQRRNLLNSPAGRLDEDPAPPLGSPSNPADATGQPGSSSSVPDQEDPPLTWHAGRAWSGHEIEDACPCPQEPCGLVSTPDPDCVQHSRTKTIRQSHRADQCPALGAGIKWTEDTTLGEPQDPGVDKVAARRAGQGPVLADRSSTEAAGTRAGALPPALVPVAEPALDPLTVIAAQIEREIRTADRQAERESSDHNDDGASYWYGYGTALEWVLRFLGDEWPHLRDGRAEYRVALAEAGEVWAKQASPIEEANEWARAVAPLVPTDGAP